MKKFLLIPAVLASLLFSHAAFALSDVDESTYYFTAIDYFRVGGVIQGYPNGEFKPDKCVNRVEFLKMLYLAVNENISAVGVEENIFSDVSIDEWYWPFLSHGLANGDVKGYADGTFRPAECVNRVEAIKLAILAFNNGRIPNFQNVFGNPFDVASIPNRSSTWWWDYYTYAFSAHIVGLDHFERYDADWSSMNVDSDFANPTLDFGPTEPITRKETAELLYRTKSVAETDVESFVEDAGLILDYIDHYQSPSSGYSFSLNDGWEIVSETYYTSGNFTADYPTIVIKNTDTGEEVIINDRFAQCIGVDADYCVELEEGFVISTEDPSKEALELIDKIILTYDVPETFVPGISTFVNDTYEYSFEYPASLNVDSNDYETPANNAFVIYVPNIKLNIEIQDPEVFAEETGYGSKISLPLKSFAEYIHEENIRIENPNFPDKEVGEMKETVVAGYGAYQFSLTDSFETERGGYILYEKYEYFIFNNGEFHVIVWIPSNNEIARTTLDTLKFD